MAADGLDRAGSVHGVLLSFQSGMIASHAYLTIFPPRQRRARMKGPIKHAH
ncbi:hypothetical protein GJA_3322 [Janthinobacterium agaricidamnosum NBRC 102515 = DSM 9628]|uniref:Uncharacterized protein n=1 Tax=Janthinobacterium agaricidamnosum NBRC 102515 = DSM 9628 TaxID=1349767 RepID=W0V9L3_9BURK|nr:hypothetical protein GJA_3322 [Janthinobacterium agaricidamnosum NBRC 102515 = DSM 9628]